MDHTTAYSTTITNRPLDCSMTYSAQNDFRRKCRASLRQVIAESQVLIMEDRHQWLVPTQSRDNLSLKHQLKTKGSTNSTSQVSRCTSSYSSPLCLVDNIPLWLHYYCQQACKGPYSESLDQAWRTYHDLVLEPHKIVSCSFKSSVTNWSVKHHNTIVREAGHALESESCTGNYRGI